MISSVDQQSLAPDELDAICSSPETYDFLLPSLSLLQGHRLGKACSLYPFIQLFLFIKKKSIRRLLCFERHDWGHTYKVNTWHLPSRNLSPVGETDLRTVRQDDEHKGGMVSSIRWEELEKLSCRRSISQLWPW